MCTNLKKLGKVGIIMTPMNAALDTRKVARALEKNAHDVLSQGAKVLRERHLKAVHTPEPVASSIISRTPEQQLAFDRKLAITLISDEQRFRTTLNPNVSRRTLRQRVTELESLRARKEALEKGANPYSDTALTQTSTSTNPFASPSEFEAIDYYDDVAREEVTIFDTAQMTGDEIEARHQKLLELSANLQANKRSTANAVSAPTPKATTDVTPTKATPALIINKEISEDKLRSQIKELEQQLNAPNLSTEKYVELATKVNKLETNLRILEIDENERKVLSNPRRISEFKMEIGQRDSIHVGPLPEPAKIEAVKRFNKQFTTIMENTPFNPHHTPTVSGPFKTLTQAIDNEQIRLANEAHANGTASARELEYKIRQAEYDDFGRQLKMQELSQQPQTPEVQARMQELQQATQDYKGYSENDILSRAKITELDDEEIRPIVDEPMPTIDGPRAFIGDLDDETVLDSNYYTGDNKPARLLFAEDTTAPKAEIEIKDADIEESILELPQPKVAEDDGILMLDENDAVELIEETPITANATPEPEPVRVPPSLSLASSTAEAEIDSQSQKTARRWYDSKYFAWMRGETGRPDAQVTDKKVANAKR